MCACLSQCPWGGVAAGWSGHEPGTEEQNNSWEGNGNADVRFPDAELFHSSANHNYSVTFS